MGYRAVVLADSIAQGARLTTLEVEMPRFVLAEFNTHRMLSRNSASSRAIPVEKRIAAVRADPFVPEAFAANQRGMQAGEALDPIAQERARQIWLTAAVGACTYAADLAKSGVHKQWANRIIEPYCWHTVIVTATEWENFFALRCHSAAQPEIRRAAEIMREAMATSTPIESGVGGWHLPLVREDMGDFAWARSFAQEHGDGDPGKALAKLSIARCARTSYLTHDGLRDPKADLELFEKLLASRHMSPFEHAAQVGSRDPDVAGAATLVDDPGAKRVWLFDGDFIGNFRAPWVQYRKMIPGEAVAPAESA